MRWSAVEAVSRYHGGAPIRDSYQRIADRRGRNIARVAAARRLLTLVFYGLRDHEIRLWCVAKGCPGNRTRFASRPLTGTEQDPSCPPPQETHPNHADKPNHPRAGIAGPLLGGYNILIMNRLLEHRPIAAIRAYFETKGLPLTVHASPPKPPSGEQMRRLPRSVRRAIETDTSTHWVALGRVARHYGSGRSEEEAIRSAAKRYRVEEAPEDAGSG